jgi:hypothetical protein
MELSGGSGFPRWRERYLITIPNRLDKYLTLFLRSLTMMHRLDKAAARQHVHKCPSIAHLLQLHFGFA